LQPEAGRVRPKRSGPSWARPRTSICDSPSEVAERVGVSRQTVIKWIERGELEAEVTPGGHHRIPASAFQTGRRSERADIKLVPARR
jgi:excisionase family DNA binding protein